MKLEQTFQVQAPIEQVWEALIDVERVAPCLPGAEITEASGDTFKGNFTVKLGPTTAAYRGEMQMESVDEAARTVTMRATGQDKRGQGGAKASIVSVMHEDGAGTRVQVETDFTITGRLARFGRGGMIKDISNKLLEDFSSCLARTIEADGAAAPPAERADGPAEPAQAPAEPADGPEHGGSSEPVVAEPEPGPTTAARPTGEVRVGVGAASRPPAPATRSAPARPASAKPVNGLALFLSVLRRRLGRLFGRG